MSSHSNRFTSTLALLISLAALSRSACAGEAVLYGGIELGSTGVKAIALPIDADGRPDLSRVSNKMPHKVVNNVTLKDLTSDQKFRPEAIGEASAAVADFYEHLTRAFKIPPERIWIVASSGLTMNKPANFDELRQAVAQATGGAKELQEIDQRRETELSIRGAIPSADWGDAILVDVGSGNIKCGYHHPKRGSHVERPFVLDSALEGTVAYSTAIQNEMKKRGLNGFAAFCGIALEKRAVLERRVADEIGRKAGLVNRPRVYLSGGAPFLISILTNPRAMAQDEEITIKFSLEDLRIFNEKLRNTGRLPFPDISRLPESLRQKAEEQVRTARDNPLCLPERMLAGSEILLGFGRALNWENKELYFTRAGLVAWIVGYVAEAEAHHVSARVSEPRQETQR